MITTSEIKRGTTVEVDGSLYQVVDVHHVKTKKSAVYRVKLRDLRAGHIIERSFNAGEKLATARVESREMQYLYAEGETLTFMNTETYDQIELAKSLVEDALPYLKEGDTAQVLTYGEEALGIELSAAVEQKIAAADPGLRGDTQSAPPSRRRWSPAWCCRSRSSSTPATPSRSPPKADSTSSARPPAEVAWDGAGAR